MRRATLVAIISMGIMQPSLVAQEDVPKEESPASYQAAMIAAQTKYTTNLEAALKLAIAEGKLDEAVHVRRMIAMEKLRTELIDTKWTRNRPRRPSTLHFHSARRVTTNAGGEGVWDVIEDRIVLVKFSDAVIMHKFNEDTTKYTVMAFGPIKTEFTEGKIIGSTK